MTRVLFCLTWLALLGWIAGQWIPGEGPLWEGSFDFADQAGDR